MNKEKAKPACTRGGRLLNHLEQQSSNIIPLKQEPLLWQAYCQTVKSLDMHPTAINQIIAQTLADAWGAAFRREVL